MYSLQSLKSFVEQQQFHKIYIFVYIYKVCYAFLEFVYQLAFVSGEGWGVCVCVQAFL